MSESAATPVNQSNHSTGAEGDNNNQVPGYFKGKATATRFPMASMALAGIKSPSDVLSPCSRKLWGRKKKFEKIVPKLSLDDN